MGPRNFPTSGLNPSNQMTDHQPLILTPEQRECLNQMLPVIQKRGLCLDLTKPGGGKTVMAVAMFKELQKIYKDSGKKVMMFVVHPGSIKGSREMEGIEPTSPWERELSKYGGMDSCHSVTIESLRINKCKSSTLGVYTSCGGVNHPILNETGERDRFQWADDINGTREREFFQGEISPGVSSLTYSSWSAQGLLMGRYTKVGASYDLVVSPTRRWMQTCIDCIPFVVMDECHTSKNKTSQNQSSAAFLSAVSRAFQLTGHGFILLLSGTFIQKEMEHAANYMKMVGTSTPVPNGMFISSRSADAYRCYQEAIKYNPEEADKIAADHSIVLPMKERNPSVSASNVSNAVVKFWMRCIMPEIHFSVPTPTYGQAFNAFMDAPEAVALEKLIAGRLTNGNSKVLSDDKILIEGALVTPIAQDALERLARDPLCKVVIALRFHQNITKAYDLLRVHYPRVCLYTGLESKSHRQTVKNQFQKNDEYRVLIGSIQTVSVGIDLHDTIGGRQRFSYIPGDDDIVSVWQYDKRVDRLGVRSHPVTFVCYSKSGEMARIYKSNEKKSEIGTAVNKTRKRMESENSLQIRKCLYETILPGDYNRCFKLNRLSKMVYLVDRPYFCIESGEDGVLRENMYPPFSQIGYIEEDTPDNRKRYDDPYQLIAYLEGIIESAYQEIDHPEEMSADDRDNLLFESISAIPGIYIGMNDALVPSDRVPRGV